MTRTQKRIAVCMDGTWQSLSQPNLTNIAVIARSVAHQDEAGVQQIVVYSHGVGATPDIHQSWTTRVFGGAFGSGFEDMLLNTYRRIAFNYEAGDDLYIFGFSRGAFAARTLANLIGHIGIVSRRSIERVREGWDLYSRRPNPTKASADDVAAYQESLSDFRKQTSKKFIRDPQSDAHFPIAYLGIFDTVGQRGMPSALGPISDLFNRKYQFLNASLGEHVRSARHAVAIDESRWAFPPTLWDNLDALNEKAARAASARLPDAELDIGADPGPPFQQRWFPGTHGDVGGGTPASRLPAIPLRWIVSGATLAGLRFDWSSGSVISEATHAPDVLEPVTTPTGADVLSPLNWAFAPRRIERGLSKKAPADRALAERRLHPAAALKVVESEARGDRRYRPAALKHFDGAIAEWAQDRAALERELGLMPGPKSQPGP